MDPELALFRIGATIAWADGELDGEERLRLGRAIREAARRDPEQQQPLNDLLDAGSPDSLPIASLEALVAALPSQLQRERAVTLAYHVMRAGRREGDHGSINDLEHQAYGQLLNLLELDSDRVAALEGEVEVVLARSTGTPVGLLASSFAGLMSWC